MMIFNKNLIRIGLIISLVFLTNIVIYSQNKLFRHAIGITSENDSYLLMGKDGYYTNGLTFTYNWTSKDTNNLTIHGIEVGQYMYNAKNGSYRALYKIDRPVTAYLFSKYTNTSFYKDNVLAYKIGVGTIGPNALGRQMQEGIHSTLGMYKPREWQFQLRNAFSVDGSVLYSPKEIDLENWLKLHPVLATDLGFTFTDLKMGFILTAGNKAKNSKSSLWNASLGRTDANTSESFFYLQPLLQYNIYNATVQGGLFIKDEHRQEITRLLYIQRMGWSYSKKKINLNLSVAYSGRESKSQIHSQWWGDVKFILFY